MKASIMPALLETPSEKVAAPRILLVDDDTYILKLVAEVLISSGYSVDTARDGEAGWEALQDHQYDLLITDNKMPKVTGLALIKKVRTEKMNLPIILVSGTMPMEELNRQAWLFPDVTLHKPFTNTELLNAVKKVLPAAKTPATSAELFRDCALVDDPLSQDKAAAQVTIRNQGKPPRLILVVDDDQDLRQLSMDALAGFGYAVEGVKDGAAGWAALQAKNYDLVITDNHMPNMTGLEMIAKLRFARMTVPIIMATGILPTQEFASNPRLKPDATLQRPFSNDALRETVKKVLRTDGGGQTAKMEL